MEYYQLIKIVKLLGKGTDSQIMTVVGYLNSESNKRKVFGHNNLRIFKVKFIGNSFKDSILLFSPLITNFKKTSIYKLPLPVKVDHLVSNP